MTPPLPSSRRRAPFLRRLSQDVAGNTLAMMAIALLPLSALAGSSIDVARLYVVKSRLQQACDAGVLAGRKFLADSNATTLDANAEQQAQTFFANNFRSGWMRTNAVSFTPRKTSDNQVSGTANATVPMTIMKMFKSPDVTVGVTCEARYDVPDADVMFVLDTTGSMACAASETSGCSQPTGSYTDGAGTSYYIIEKADSKIKALRTAVLDFYDTITTNSNPSTHIRYGFVPYASAVNIWDAIKDDKPNYVLNTKWTYQSRRVVGDFDTGNTLGNYGPYTGVSQADCNYYNGLRDPATGWRSDGKATKYTTDWKANAGGTCSGVAHELTPLWKYAPWTADISNYVLGNDVQDPSQVVPKITKWRGCIEERDTTASSSFNATSLPPDLDPDLIPTNDATKWRPMWPEQIWWRGNQVTYQSADDTANIGGDYRYVRAGYTRCGKVARRLDEMTRSEVSTYVNDNDFRPMGSTYHDIGMIWGTRFISPTGPFASDTAPWPGRNAPNRHIIFMTDGDMAPSTTVYGSYGLELSDKRVTGGDFASQTARHNARFVAECQAARARNIAVWVVAFGQSLNDEMRACATQDGQHAFYASDDAALKAAFRKIAEQVAQLRVSK